MTIFCRQKQVPIWSKAFRVRISSNAEIFLGALGVYRFSLSSVPNLLVFPRLMYPSSSLTRILDLVFCDFLVRGELSDSGVSFFGPFLVVTSSWALTEFQWADFRQPGCSYFVLFNLFTLFLFFNFEFDSDWTVVHHFFFWKHCCLSRFCFCNNLIDRRRMVRISS